MADPTPPRVLAPPAPLDVIPARAWAPDGRDRWWVLAIPVVLVIALILIRIFDPDFFHAWVLPEGYGVLELSQFLMMVAGFVLCVRMIRMPIVRESRLLWWAMLFFALSTFYIAGEEHSWGQHFVNWNTPSYWAEINRQQETNLHNISPWFNQRPKLVFDLAILIGGIIVPLIQARTAPFRQPLLALLTPPLALVPVALIALAFKVIERLDKHILAGADLFIRPSETVETFEYMFVLFYLIVLARRLTALERAGVRQITL